MIVYQTGDIFTSKAQVLVDPVNCRFRAGGLAGDFMRRFPAMFQCYRGLCVTEDLAVGRPALYTGSTPWILLFPVKHTWEEKYARLQDIEDGLQGLLALLAVAPPICSLAFPRLGCGMGRLSWKQVQPLMETYLSRIDATIEIWSLQ